MNTSDNWSMLAQYLSGEFTDEQKNRVDARIAAEPELKKMLEFMKQAWNTSEVQNPSDIETLWGQVAQKAGLKTNKERVSATVSKQYFADNYLRIFRYAAAILVIFTLGYVINNTGLFWGSSKFVTMTVQNGEREEVTLSDGTRIILDSGSTLNYPEYFEGEERQVRLNGEGYFEVAHNPEKPFNIKANHGLIKVLGTKFNVRAWAENQKVTLAVTEGKVSLNSEQRAARDAVILVKNQFSELPMDGTPTAPEPVDVTKYLAWMQNQFYFENAPLDEILAQLERWYNVTFVLKDKSLTKERLNLHIKNDPLDDTLALISVLTDCKYSQSGKTITLYK